MNVIFDDEITRKDFLENTMHLAAGVSVLDVSGSWMTNRQKERYFEAEAAALAENIQIQVILTGGVCNLETATRIIKDTNIRLIGLCFPFINDPLLLKK